MVAPEEPFAVLGDKPSERLSQDHYVPIIPFEEGRRKDDVMDQQARHFDPPKGVFTLASPGKRISCSAPTNSL
jgi:hypothetical protein